MQTTILCITPQQPQPQLEQPQLQPLQPISYKRPHKSTPQSEQYNTTHKYRSIKNSTKQSSECTYKCSNDQSQQLSCTLDKQEYSNQNQNQKQKQNQKDKPQLSVIEQKSIASSIPLIQRFSSLLTVAQSAPFNVEQRKLIQFQIKLDQLLDYLRLHRRKAKGQYFSVLRKMLKQNCQIFFDLQHIKQILYLIPDFYCYSPRNNQSKGFDVMIGLPEFVELEARKIQFRNRMLEHLTQKQAFTTNKNYKIPLFNFPFEQKPNPQKHTTLIHQIQSSNKPHFLFPFSTTPTAHKLNPLDALKPQNAHNYHQQLLQKIRQKQQYLQQKRQQQKVIKYGLNQQLAVFDEIPKIYKKRQKNSMFISSLLQDLDQSLNIKLDMLCCILDKLVDQWPEFFHVVQHKSGRILQIGIKGYNQVRNKIIQAGERKDKQQMNEKQQNNNSNKPTQDTAQKPKTPLKSKSKAESRSTAKADIQSAAKGANKSRTVAEAPKHSPSNQKQHQKAQKSSSKTEKKNLR